jgi:hypothetical protein
VTLEVHWVPDAVEDMQGGHTWYEDREPGLGRDFAVAVFDALDQATRFPLLARRYEHVQLPDLPEVRKVQLERFTEYGIVYTLVGETLWILAVAHSKRRPGFWAGRLGKIPKP